MTATTRTDDRQQHREIDRIVDLLDRAGGGDAWHGPSVADVLSTLTPEQAAARPLAGAHSIWELALHIAVWEGVVARRIGGEEVEPTPEEDWPSAGDPTPRGWERALRGLREARMTLRNALLAFDPQRLDETVPGRNYSFYVMMHGVIQHDLYHAGQIALLRKALT